MIPKEKVPQAGNPALYVRLRLQAKPMNNETHRLHGSSQERDQEGPRMSSTPFNDELDDDDDDCVWIEEETAWLSSDSASWLW